MNNPVSFSRWKHFRGLKPGNSFYKSNRSRMKRYYCVNWCLLIILFLVNSVNWTVVADLRRFWTMDLCPGLSYSRVRGRDFVRGVTDLQWVPCKQTLLFVYSTILEETCVVFCSAFSVLLCPTSLNCATAQPGIFAMQYSKAWHSLIQALQHHWTPSVGPSGATALKFNALILGPRWPWVALYYG